MVLAVLLFTKPSYRQNRQTNKKYVQHNGMEWYAFDPVRKLSDMDFSP